ncbi:membrane protein implicated in regulation of membrane protease activity [Bradyrhizobium sp. CIR48]|uniref:O-antigen ligase family protein n=1 Tax=Bradyrhizobium sp. CIR48 TaxID=2663840 RepID=UPI0016068355|nr:O-antigen ligase family protein [Bradyrhizobium sp. CIR48]MBB4428358.1 membrane protein implicated in regulation of membrane protease activity [Bradyrhizobium sp. CIR48]
MLNIADHLAVALAFSLPLSTSATSILAILWLLAVLPTLRFREVRREVLTPEGCLPLLLVLLAVIGMLWADIDWSARVAGLRPFLKLLAIPLLFVQFQHSDRGWRVLYGLLAGCVLLLIASFISILLDRSLTSGKTPGVVAKDYISQSGFFVLSIFLLLELAVSAWREKRIWLLAGQLCLIAAFLLNLSFVATSRTALFIIPVLCFLFSIRRGWKSALGVCAIWTVLFLATWHSSLYLERRLQSAFSLEADDNRLNAISNRQRVTYWQTSLQLIKQAPFIGHGTGSIPDMFQHYTATGTDSDINRVANPHNETFRIALQLGALGAAMLYGMWVAHARMFGGSGAAAWFGLAALAQNVLGSLVNSHISDFTQGWTYAICVGVAGGIVKRTRFAGSAVDNSSLHQRKKQVSPRRPF